MLTSAEHLQIRDATRRQRAAFQRSIRRASVHLLRVLAAAGSVVIVVHHLSYRHLGAEPLNELLGCCRPCHVARHPWWGAPGEGEPG